MKILQIIPSLQKGGAERLVLDICNELSFKKNVQVKLVTFYNKNEYQHLTGDIDWEVVPSKFIPSITSKSIMDISSLQKAIDNFQPDIIHTHLWEAELTSRQINYPKAKWFSHFHDNIAQLSKLSLPLTKQKVTNFYERLLILKKYKTINNNFVCIAKHSFFYAKSNLPKQFSDNIHLLHNAINYQKFRNKTEQNINSKVLKLVNVGSLVEKKNQVFLVDLMNVLKSRGIMVHLTLLGDGPNKQQISSEIRTSKLENDITLHGNVNNPEHYYWNSDVYVHSATYEPLGLVLLEAMAAGLPVVTLDGGGNRDIIEQGKNGYMIYEQNPELFANKIIELWENKVLYKRISEYASNYAKQYEIKSYCDKLLEIYKKA